MKLTDKQQSVYDGLIKKSNNNHIESSHKSHLQNELGLNAVSFGLVIKALIDKNLIKVEKDGGVNLIPTDSSTFVEKKKPVQTSAPVSNKNGHTLNEKKEILEDKPKNIQQGEMFTYHPEDFNQNLFFELKACGANFSPSQYSFFSKNVDVVEKMKEIIKFYESPNDTLTKSQRALRDMIVNKHNIDMECKKLDNKLFFLNTWGIASVKDVVKDIISNGRKNVTVSENRIIVEIDNNN